LKTVPKISVIIPNYNHALFLKKRIETVFNQTFQDFEIIILDDCSSDDSKEIIEEYRKHRQVSHIVYNKENSGSTFKQWEKGIELAKGEFIWIAESDDWADTSFLEKLIPVVDYNELTGLVYCQSYDVNEKGDIIESRITWTNYFEENIWKDNFCIKGKTFLKYLYNRNVIPNVSACLIRKSCIKDVVNSNNFSENLKICGDWFTWLLISNNENIYISFLNEHLNYFRALDQSTRNHKKKKDRLARIREEAIIFNSGKFEIETSIFNQKNKDLKDRWISIFLREKFSYSFFSICPLTGIRKLDLLKEYLNKKSNSK
jgi:glycosyltransferase involved in cell wall biosynthesis